MMCDNYSDQGELTSQKQVILPYRQGHLVTD
jgi:hypothetical protein